MISYSNMIIEQTCIISSRIIENTQKKSKPNSLISRCEIFSFFKIDVVWLKKITPFVWLLIITSFFFS
jgi:hypothetical protein